MLRSDGVRVARKVGRRVAFVPTDSIATAAAAVRSWLKLCYQCAPATRFAAVEDACALVHASGCVSLLCAPTRCSAASLVWLSVSSMFHTRAVRQVDIRGWLVVLSPLACMRVCLRSGGYVLLCGFVVLRRCSAASLTRLGMYAEDEPRAPRDHTPEDDLAQQEQTRLESTESVALSSAPASNKSAARSIMLSVFQLPTTSAGFHSGARACRV